MLKSCQQVNFHLFLTLILIFCMVPAQGSLIGEEVDERVAHVNLPENFKISVFAEVPRARSMALSPSGILYVSTRSSDKVYAVMDNDGDYKADQVKVILEGLVSPNGIAYKDGDLYIAETHRVHRFNDIDMNLENPVGQIIKSDLPTNRSHGWRYIKFGPDQKLYIAIGAPCNICEAGDPFHTVCRMDADGSNFEVFARGVRNSVGFDWDPQYNEIWMTDNGRDFLGDDLPPDELNHAPVIGLHFGYPYCHGGDLQDPQFGHLSCQYFAPPAHNFQAHSANLGIHFYNGMSFPEKYRRGAFVAQHGSWNRSTRVGYRLMFLEISDRKVLSAEVFADGWLREEDQTRLGRPVDIIELPDGSLLVTDDQEGLIYRITYHHQEQPEEEP